MGYLTKIRRRTLLKIAGRSSLGALALGSTSGLASCTAQVAIESVPKTKVLMKVGTQHGGTGKAKNFGAVLTYDEVAGAQRIEEKREVRIDWSARNGSGQSRDPSLMAYARLVEAVDLIGLAVSGMDTNHAARAIQIRKNEYPELKRVALASKDQVFVNKAFMFEHFSRELEELIEQRALHQHSLQRKQLQKELHYRKFLMDHHRHRH